MSEESTESSEEKARMPGFERSDSVRKAGTVAYQSILAGLVLGVLIAVTGALGFLVYRGVMEPGAFLLLTGILVGFCLGRLDAVL